MLIDRREFVRSSVALVGLSAIGGCRHFASEKPLLTVGALADTHIRDADGLAMFECTLRHFKANGVDVVVHAGDITNDGLRSQLSEVAKRWFSVFPADEATPVEFFAVYGNRDFKLSSITDPEERIRNSAISIYTDPYGEWKRLFGHEMSDVYLRRIGGYCFIGAQYGKEHQLAQFLREHDDLLDSDRPFFYVQHPHPKGTCFAPLAAADSGASTAVLSGYPNAIAISGHAHQSLQNDLALWQGSFLSLGPGAHWAVKKTLGQRERRPAHQSAILRLYADRLVISRRDCVEDVSLGPDWIVPLPYKPKVI